MQDPGGNRVRYMLPDPPPLDPGALNRGGLVLRTAPPGYLSWGQRLIAVRDTYDAREPHRSFEDEYKTAVRYMWRVAVRNSHARGRNDDWRKYPTPPGLISRFDPERAAMRDPTATNMAIPLDPVGRLNYNLIALEFFIHAIVKDVDLMWLARRGMLFIGRSIESTPIDGGVPTGVNWPGDANPPAKMVYGQRGSAIERILKKAPRGFVAFALRNDIKDPRGRRDMLISAHVHVRDWDTGETTHRKYRVDQKKVDAKLRALQADPGVHHVLSMRHTTYELVHIGEVTKDLSAPAPHSSLQ